MKIFNEVFNEVELKKLKNISDRIEKETEFCPFCRKKKVLDNKSEYICPKDCIKVVEEYGILSNIVRTLDTKIDVLFDNLNRQMIQIDSFSVTYKIRDLKGLDKPLRIHDPDDEHSFNLIFDGDSGYFCFIHSFDRNDEFTYSTRKINRFTLKDKIKIINAIPDFIKQINNKLLNRTETSFKAFSTLTRITAMFKVLENTKSIKEETVEFMNFLTSWQNNYWIITKGEIEGDESS